MAKRDKEEWYLKSWRPAAAFVYMFICLTDFVFMPAYYEYTNHKAKADHTVELALQFKDSASQIEALKTLRETQTWDPLTLKSSGMIHMAFLAILGVSAWTRGQEKIEEVKKTDTGPEAKA